MRRFGSSSPPGCSGTPYDEEGPDMPPPLEDLFLKLEEAGVEQALIDAGYQAIYTLMAEANRECPRCLDATLKDAYGEQEREL